MEVKKRRKFTKGFKTDVLNMLKTGDKKVSVLSKDLGISEQVIYRWYKQGSPKSKEEEKVSE